MAGKVGAPYGNKNAQKSHVMSGKFKNSRKYIHGGNAYRLKMAKLAKQWKIG
jgi:hypothetical protein